MIGQHLRLVDVLCRRTGFPTTLADPRDDFVIASDWISTEDPRWTDVLKQTAHDVYHLPSYVRLDASMQQAKPLAFWVGQGNRRLLIPLLSRTVVDTDDRIHGSDLSSPYGLAGPLWVFDKNDNQRQRASFREQAVAELATSMRESPCCTAFLRMHPLMSDGEEAWRAVGHRKVHGETVYCDLTLPKAERWRHIRPRFRSYIRRAQRAGYRVIQDRRWDRIDEFVDLYYESMLRVGASTFYFFPRQYFYQLAATLRDRAALFFVVDAERQTTGGGIFTESPHGYVHYHLGATRTASMNQHVSKLLLHHVQNWAAARGNRVFHLGGGVQASADSLFRFKSGFSKLRATYSSWRFIADEQAYGELCNDWEKCNGRSADTIHGFFPAYRKPAQQPLEVLQSGTRAQIFSSKKHLTAA